MASGQKRRRFAYDFVESRPSGVALSISRTSRRSFSREVEMIMGNARLRIVLAG